MDGIKVRIGDVEIECTGRGDELRENLARAISVLKETLPERLGAGASKNSTPTVKDLLARSRARSFGDKAIVIAWWLEEHGGRRRWRTGDVVEQLEKAGEPLPSNMTDALSYKEKQGLFEVENRLWKLTEKGRGWFESLVDAESLDPTAGQIAD